MPGTGMVASDTAYSDGGSWWRLDNTTALVKYWLDGTFGNYGFMVRDATESGTTQWTTFYSSDAPSPNKPELHIVYEIPVEITSASPTTGYLLLDEPSTLSAWVTGTNPTVTFRYPASGTEKLSSTLSYNGSYYTTSITPVAANTQPGVYVDGEWVSPGGLFTATESGVSDTYPSSLYICRENFNYYSSIDSTFTRSSFEGVSTPVISGYNCLAWALNITSQRVWPWDQGDPTQPSPEQVYQYLVNDLGLGISEVQANGFADIIFYDFQPGHFAKATFWDSNGYVTKISSKWGDLELINSLSVDPFIASYGPPIAYYKFPES